ncbi:hypothetical protein D1007_45641 [Hordeum vulgare]|nr:hypothetical protein D1007_45641 [Hordeum vulgare]
MYPSGFKRGRWGGRFAIAFPLSLFHLALTLVLATVALPPRARTARRHRHSLLMAIALTAAIPPSNARCLPAVNPLGNCVSRLLFSTPSPANDEMGGLPIGSWEGSIMTDEHIAYLRRTQKLPPVEHVEARAPGNERMSEPHAGGRVMFGMHFLVGFELPMSRFLRLFLDFYGLQMHHLGPNSVL